VRCGYEYGYGYLGMKKLGIPKTGMGMGMLEPGILFSGFYQQKLAFIEEVMKIDLLQSIKTH
jgi:hypothetical protein